MEPRTRWIIAGVAAVVLAFGYIYLKNKNAAAASATQPIVVGSGTDLSTASNIPQTGYDAGNTDAFTGSGYNGLGAGGSPLAGSQGFGGTTITNECNCPMIPAGVATTTGPPPCNCPQPVGSTGGTPTVPLSSVVVNPTNIPAGSTSPTVTDTGQVIGKLQQTTFVDPAGNVVRWGV